MRFKWWRCWTVVLPILFTVFLIEARAEAHAWQLRHGYGQCATCHLDPSGAGLLTQYGRGMGEVLLRAPYGVPTSDDDSIAVGGFAWGTLEPPAPILLGGSVRALWLRTKSEAAPLLARTILMQADVAAGIDTQYVVASGSLGYADEGALGATITRSRERNLVSRHHWIGYRFDEDRHWLVRGGRMNLPFGIRTTDHALWTQVRTQTNIDDDQQYGASLHLSFAELRAEVMGIVGNFQLRPDDYRERGYSAYAEWLVFPALAVGASSLITHRERDVQLLVPSWRHAHGGFARWSTPHAPLVVLTEWDYVRQSARGFRWRDGLVGYLQADYELVQGLHFMGTLEAEKYGIAQHPNSWAGWLSYAWFFAPHVDLRLDCIYRSLGSERERTNVLMSLAQVHVYL